MFVGHLETFFCDLPVPQMSTEVEWNISVEHYTATKWEAQAFIVLCDQSLDVGHPVLRTSFHSDVLTSGTFWMLGDGPSQE